MAIIGIHHAQTLLSSDDFYLFLNWAQSLDKLSLLPQNILNIQNVAFFGKHSPFLHTLGLIWKIKHPSLDLGLSMVYTNF